MTRSQINTVMASADDMMKRYGFTLPPFAYLSPQEFAARRRDARRIIDARIGEVSKVNDDETDNLFREPIGRFAQIEEDVAPMHLLVSDYDSWLPTAD